MSMLRLELDWAASEPAPLGPDAPEGVPTGILVQQGSEAGPAGWPTIVVWVPHYGSYRSYQLLESWLRNVYLADLDEPERTDQANDLANMAQELP